LSVWGGLGTPRPATLPNLERHLSKEGMMTTEPNGQRLQYEAPRALRVGDGRQAGGEGAAPGSGYLDVCMIGIDAGTDYIAPGSGFISAPI